MPKSVGPACTLVTAVTGVFRPGGTENSISSGRQGVSFPFLNRAHPG